MEVPTGARYIGGHGRSWEQARCGAITRVLAGARLCRCSAATPGTRSREGLSGRSVAPSGRVDHAEFARGSGAYKHGDEAIALSERARVGRRVYRCASFILATLSRGRLQEGNPHGEHDLRHDGFPYSHAGNARAITITGNLLSMHHT